MASGKRKHRGLQTYGRSNNHNNANQRVAFLRAQELFFDQSNQDIDASPDRVQNTGASQPKHTQPGQQQKASRDSVVKKKEYKQSSLAQNNFTNAASASTKRTSPAMAVEPSENDVESVISIIGCGRDQAIRYLKVKKDVAGAIGAIMDGEDITKQEQDLNWDDSVWNTDREGNATMGDNNLHPLGGTSTAPTRVPSPAMNMGVPASRDDEDAQLAQALAASRGDDYQQESGILHADGTSQQTYGPVNKDQSAHDRQWGMVLSPQGASSSEIVPDVERPEERKHVEGEPRFLKTLPSGDYLPNFLTIAHSIPAVREALLMRDYTMAQYGTDAEWWRGNQIALPKIVHTENGAPADAEIDRFDQFIAETQRLMAALDASQRAYASVNALTKTELLLSGGNVTLTENFIDKLCSAADAHTDNYDKLASLFKTRIGTTNPAGTRTPYATVLPLDVKTAGEDKVQLMEVLDSLLWDTDIDETGDNYIANAGDIIVMHAKQTNMSAEKLQLEITPTLFIDKYLEKNVHIARPARLEIAREKERVAKINEIEKKLTRWQMRGKEIDARAMLQHTLGHFSGKNMADAENADKENGIVVNGTSAPEQPHYADIAAKLEAVLSSVDKKLVRLAEQRESIQKNISKLSKASPTELEQEGLKERYTLMGVATKASITYVLRPKEDHDEDDDHMSTENDDEATPDGMQWWRIEYAVNGSQPRISKAKVEGDIVIQAVEVEHSSALLVYASDRAVDFSTYDPTLPLALQQFVQDDDFHFNVELHESTRSNPPPAYDYAHDSDIPRQSIEPADARRGSMDSTVAEIGGLSNRASPTSGAAFYNHGYAPGGPAGAGLPPTASAQHVENRSADSDVAEIHLSPTPQDAMDVGHESGTALHREMAETEHREPFAPGLQQQQQQQQQRRNGSDAAMEDVRGAR
ncbi:hypothetical protein Q7P35_008130 [Cladosporium inversicolor]